MMLEEHSQVKNLLVTCSAKPLGRVGDRPFYIDHRQLAVWGHTQLVLDERDGEPEGFSLAAGDDRHFVTRSRVFSACELDLRAPLCGRPAP